jgi:DNA-binding XRE family transcriptional regulator
MALKPIKVDFLEQIVSSEPALKKRYSETREALQVAQLIREMRIAAKLTQQELARRAGFTQPRVAQLERGIGLLGVRLSTLERIATACGRQISIRTVPSGAVKALKHGIKITE